MAFGCVNLPIAQWLYQSCVAQMWSRRAELIPSKVWRRADHMYLSSLMASGMKNKILIADPPPAISWHVERDRRREEEKNNRKKKKNENAFALVVTPLRSLVSREFTIPGWGSVSPNVRTCAHKHTHVFYMGTHMHARTDIHAAKHHADSEMEAVLD